MSDGCRNREPDFLSAGDTLRFKKYFGSYNPQNGWSLSYSIIGGGIAINFQSTPTNDQNGFLIEVLPAVTALWLPNDAAILTGYAIRQANWNGGNNNPERREIYYQLFPIKPNLQTPKADQPFLTRTEKALNALWELYLNKANDDVLIAHVGDSSFKFDSLDKVYEAICMLEARQQRELDRQRAANGKPSRRRVTPIMRITPYGQLWGTAWPYSGYLGGS